MKTIGFPICHKENENRRAIIPDHISCMKYSDNLYFEKGYGEVLGIEDEEYVKCGCNICSREECLSKDIICDPKIGDAEYLKELNAGQVVFGWVHATQNKSIADLLIKRKLTAYAWENMYYMNRHVFWRNNELAGEAAVLHAFQCYAKMPYETKVAVIGNGNTARGVIKILNMLGAEIMQYTKKTEKLLRDEIGNYDVIVNCVLWDIFQPKSQIILAAAGTYKDSEWVPVLQESQFLKQDDISVRVKWHSGAAAGNLNLAFAGEETGISFRTGVLGTSIDMQGILSEDILRLQIPVTGDMVYTHSLTEETPFFDKLFGKRNAEGLD